MIKFLNDFQKTCDRDRDRDRDRRPTERTTSVGRSNSANRPRGHGRSSPRVLSSIKRSDIDKLRDLTELKNVEYQVLRYLLDVFCSFSDEGSQLAITNLMFD